MTKQEKIKEAWGELWNSFNESAKKCALSKDGYVASILQNGLNKDFTEFDTALVAWRPKSLQGIEDNNGWIRIQSEDDLPKDEEGLYHVTNIDKDKFLPSESYHVLEKLWRAGTITHYQPIVKPKPPIY